jgi:hypothetical protein
MAKPAGYLTRRDRNLLAFVQRYRLATEAMLAEVFFPAGNDSTPNVSRVLRRLRRQGLLRRVQYSTTQAYFVLTRRGCRALGTAPHLPRPLTEQSLPATAAIAWYCVRQQVTRFMSEEFRQRYPQLWRRGLPCSSYYLTKNDQGLVLGMFLIDRGGTPRRIKGKLRRIIAQRRNLPAYTSLIEAGRFRVTILTGLADQRQNIQRYLGRARFGRLEIDVALVPELGELLSGR